MERKAIIIHGWEETPKGQWYSWVGEQLSKSGWTVDVPEMPNTKTPKLKEWMDMLDSLSPDKNTLLIGHSLANALILKYIERPGTEIRGAVMVAAWDWLMEDVKEFHQTFFETGFEYEIIRQKHIPIVIVNSTTDPWIQFEKSKPLAQKINARFMGIEKAGHFMEMDGYKEFPKLVEIVEKEFNK